MSRVRSRSSISSLIDHFNSAHRSDLVASADALVNGSVEGFRKLIDRITHSKIVQQISNRVNSARDACRGFFDQLEQSSPAIKALFGTVLSGVGGAAIAEAVGLAAYLGITVVSVELIALALILLGLSIALPAIWGIVAKKVEAMFADLGL